MDIGEFYRTFIYKGENETEYSLLCNLLKDNRVQDLLDVLQKRHPPTFTHSLIVYHNIINVFGDIVAGSDLIDLGTAALLHDIGKARIPYCILEKPTKLTAKEMHTVREHATYSFNILRNYKFSDKTCLAVYQHHEKLDGSGYPLALNDGCITKLARILAIADIYSALTESRSYRIDIQENPIEIMKTMQGLDEEYFRILVDKVGSKWEFYHSKSCKI